MLNLDFTPSRVIRLDFTQRIFTRDRTHIYLLVEDHGHCADFLTLDNGSVDLVSLERDDGHYVAQPTRGEKWTLEPYAVPYDFKKAVMVFWTSNLGKSPAAKRAMAKILGESLPEEGSPPRIETDPRQRGLQAAPDAPRRSKRDPKPRKPQTTSGYSLAQLCTDLKLIPSEMRVTLRSSGIQKPGSRWEWPTREAAMEALSKVLPG